MKQNADESFCSVLPCGALELSTNLPVRRFFLLQTPQVSLRARSWWLMADFSRVELINKAGDETMKDASEIVEATALAKSDAEISPPQSAGASATGATIAAVEQIGSRIGNYRW